MQESLASELTLRTIWKLFWSDVGGGVLGALAGAVAGAFAGAFAGAAALVVEDVEGQRRPSKILKRQTSGGPGLFFFNFN